MTLKVGGRVKFVQIGSKERLHGIIKETSNGGKITLNDLNSGIRVPGIDKRLVLIKPNPNDTPVNELLEKIKEEKAILEKQRKELQKKRRKMPKQKDPKLDIIEVLKQNKEPMLAVNVWKNSKYYIGEFKDKGIDDYYKSLSDLVEQNKIIEHRENENKEIYLSLSK